MIRVRLPSKFKSISHFIKVFSLITASSRHIVPSWVTDEDGKKSQKLVWELIANELESIEPGCVDKIL